MRAGIYRHHKGGLYNVLGIVTDSTNGAEDRHMVLYTSLTLEGAQPGSTQMHVRDINEFTGQVHHENTDPDDWFGGEGWYGPRFRYEGEVLTESMLNPEA